jgi:hypothetical protein
MKLPHFLDDDDASLFQTCMHEAGHALLTLLARELTLKDPAITHPQDSLHTARTELTAVVPHQKTAAKSRELVRCASAGRLVEDRLSVETKDSEWCMVVNHVGCSEDMILAARHMSDGGLVHEEEALWDDAKAQVDQHWNFVCALAEAMYRTAPAPFARQAVLDLAVQHRVLPQSSHP